MLHLDDATLARLLDPRAVRDAVWEAFAAWGRGEASTTQRVRTSAGQAMASAMAAVVPPYCGGKLYATHDGRFTFVNVLFDVDGALLCSLDGEVLTALRTPACSSLAIHHLAVPGATTAALLGSGGQAWPHLEMLVQELPDLVELRVQARRPNAAATLAERAVAELGAPAVPYDRPADAVEGADVVVTVTRSTTPLFPAGAVSDRALICAVGATKADRCEIGPDVVERCHAVVCDDAVGSRTECGDLIQAAAAGRFDWSRAIELHAVAAGTVVPARAGAAPVLFETQGVAIQDVAAAGLAWRRHRDLDHEREMHA
jgi:ornithine cyclodeaminase